MIKCMALEVIEQALVWLKTQPIWLCTVLSAEGSAPHDTGSMLVTNSEGQHKGTLSGGCIEEQFLSELLHGKFNQASQRVDYGDNLSAAQEKLACGGIASLLVEHISPSAEAIAQLELIREALAGERYVRKSVALGNPANVTTIEGIATPGITFHGDTLQQILGADTQLLIAGFSPIGLYCAQFAKALGYDVIICEHRDEVIARYPEFASAIRPCFPARYLEKESIAASTAIIATTHDPRIDDLTLMEAVKTPAFYIGAMGSEHSTVNRRQRLKEAGGISDEELNRIHAPIGIPIGSTTPAEIAISIIAEIIAIKNNVKR